MRCGRLDVVTDARTAALVGRPSRPPARRAPGALRSPRSAGATRADQAPPVAAVRTAPPPPPTLVDIEVDTGSSPDFVRLASSVVALLPTLLAGAAAADPSRRTAPPTARAAVYARIPSSLADGRLVLTRVAASGGEDGGGGAAAAPPDGVLSLDGADAAAEDWLTRQAVVPLPDGGSLVLPLSAGRFLVGLLVVELDAPVEENESSSSSLPPPPYTPTPADAAALRGAASVLASAAALDARAALDAADAGARRARAAALVESARGPLAALRTFSAMLAPRAAAAGAVEADLAAGIATQGDALASVVSALASALHPPALPPRGGAAAARATSPFLELPPTAPASPPRALPAPGPPRPAERGGGGGECDAGAVAAAALDDATPRAAALGVALDLDSGTDGEEEGASGSPLTKPRARAPRAGVPCAALAAALGDAVDSALQRCARGGRVSVRVRPAPGGAVLVDVIDSGSGMAGALAARLRAARGSDAGEPEPTPPPADAPPTSPNVATVMERLAAGLPAGSGAAALAAATRAANAAGGRVTVVAADGGGTRVRVWLPPPPPA